jgi:hypothetical protein
VGEGSGDASPPPADAGADVRVPRADAPSDTAPPPLADSGGRDAQAEAGVDALVPPADAPDAAPSELVGCGQVAASPIGRMAFSRDGTKLGWVSYVPAEGKVFGEVWNVVSGARVASARYMSGIAPAMTNVVPEPFLLVTYDDRGVTLVIRVLDAATGMALRTLSSREEGSYATASADGSRLAFEKRGGALDIWSLIDPSPDVTTSPLPASHSLVPARLRFSPDVRFVATPAANNATPPAPPGVWIWSADTGALVQAVHDLPDFTHAARPEVFELSAGARSVVLSAAGQTAVVRTTDSTTLARFDAAEAAAFSTTGDLALKLAGKGEIAILTETGAPRAAVAWPHAASALVFSPDGKRLAAADGRASVIDLFCWR